ncbi:MAG TPA: hypothetical protein VNS09_16085 [Solirubrobacter sp.]|nr:hypothetical protein [Solirubrobacter sp.]
MSETLVMDADLGPVRLRSLSWGEYETIRAEVRAVDMELATAMIDVDATDGADAALGGAAFVETVLMRHRLARAVVVGENPPGFVVAPCAAPVFLGWLIEPTGRWTAGAVERCAAWALKTLRKEVMTGGDC